MARRQNWLALFLIAIPILRADSVFIKSVASGQYIGRAADGVTLAANAQDCRTAETFERLYPGNGYLILQTGSTGSFVAFPDRLTAMASAATAHDADKLAASAPRASDSAISIRVRATGQYLVADSNQNGVVTASAANPADNTAWFTLEPASSTQPAITIDFSDRRQSIQGFGGAIAYYGNWLTAHPNKQSIYSALFDQAAGLGMSILRLQNNFRYQPALNFDADSAEIASTATAIRNGSPIAIEMTSWTPPASLKSNNSENCAGTKNCTLATVNGAFNYDGLAAYWADSLAAYATLGIHPTWISLQNEPDWIADYGSCRLDPAESIVGGIHYAGYNKALDAVAARLSQMMAPPIIIGPEVLGVGYNTLTNYMAQLDSSKLGAIAHHLYHGGSEAAPDSFNPVFESIQSKYSALPRLMTEFGRGGGFATAWLIHNSLVVEEASAYLYWGAIWPDKNNLIDIESPWDKSHWTTPNGWKANDQYYALEHYSRFVQPGFQRFTALTNQPDLRVSAYQSPDAKRVVLVAINTSSTSSLTVAVGFDGILSRSSAIYRTGFADTRERFASVGSLEANGSVTIGPQSVVTLVLDQSQPWAQASLARADKDYRGTGFMFHKAALFCALTSAAVVPAARAEEPNSTPVTTEVNKALPSWIKFSGEERLRYENLSDVNFGNVNDGYLLTRFRFNLNLTPATWLRFSFQAQDSRVLGQNTLPAPATQKDQMDLRIGYVEFGAENGPLALRVGRQPLIFGDSRLLGDPDWSNVGRTFDAAKLTARVSWGKLDLFSGAYVKVDPLSFSEPVPSQHLDGAYGSLTKIIPGGVVEPYMIWRMEHSFKNEAGRIGNLDEKTFGLRVAGKLPYYLDYNIEAADQHGSYASDLLRAWALHEQMGFTLHKFHAYGEYNVASGDKNPKDGFHQSFDQLYPAGHDKLGMDDLFAWSNIKHSRQGVDYKVLPRLTLSAAVNNYWLQTPRDALYNSSSKVIAKSAAGTAGTYVGAEYDVQGKWTLRPGTVATMGVGRLVAGEFLKHTTAGLTYNLFSVGLTQRF